MRILASSWDSIRITAKLNEKSHAIHINIEVYSTVNVLQQIMDFFKPGTARRSNHNV